MQIGHFLRSAIVAVLVVGSAAGDDDAKSSEKTIQDLRIGIWFKKADRGGIDCSWEFGKNGRLEIKIGGELAYWGTYRFTSDNLAVITLIWSGDHSTSRFVKKVLMTKTDEITVDDEIFTRVTRVEPHK